MKFHPTAGLAALAALALLAGCSAAPQLAESPEEFEPRTIQVGTVPVATAIPLYIAIEQGFFEEVGLTVEPVVSPNFQASLANVLNGEFAFGLAANVPLFVSASKDAPIRVVAQTSIISEGVTDAVVTLDDAPIESPSDLEGKTVAVVALSTPQDTGIKQAVIEDGGDPSKVQFLELPSAQMIAALEGGQVDAIAASEPWVTIAKDAGHRAVFSYLEGIFPEGSVFAGFFANESLIESDPELVDRFRSAMIKAADYAQENEDEARAALLTFTEMGPDVVAEIGLPPFTAEVDIEANEELQDILGSFDLLGSKIDVSEFFYAAD